MILLNISLNNLLQEIASISKVMEPFGMQETLQNVREYFLI